MDQSLYTVSYIDWAKIDVWCCGQYFSPQEIDKHVEKVHENNHESKTIDVNFGKDDKMEKETLKADRKMYPCQLCPKSFFNKSIFEMHMKVHRKNSVIKREAGLTEETPGEDSPKRPKLDECSSNVPSVISVEVRKYSCYICDKTFVHSGALSRHRKIHLKKQYSCNNCGKSFSRGYYRNQHVKQCVLKEKVCLNQGDVTESQDVLVDQSAKGGDLTASKRFRGRPIKTNKSANQCNVCMKKFQTEWHLKRHRSRHNPDLAACKCRYCGKVFSHNWLLQCHEKTHVSAIKRVRPLNLRSLMPLKDAHTGNEAIIDAEKNSDTNDNLNKGQGESEESINSKLREDLGEDAFPCSYENCSKSFLTKKGLNQHMSIHSGVKPYKCDKCSKEFNTKGSLKIHQRIHTGLKPHKCDECCLEFTQLNHLLHHNKNKHLTTRPYACQQCDKAFSNPSTLKKHIRYHVKEAESLPANLTEEKTSEKAQSKITPQQNVPKNSTGDKSENERLDIPVPGWRITPQYEHLDSLAMLKSMETTFEEKINTGQDEQENGVDHGYKLSMGMHPDPSPDKQH